MALPPVLFSLTVFIITTLILQVHRAYILMQTQLLGRRFLIESRKGFFSFFLGDGGGRRAH